MKYDMEFIAMGYKMFPAKTQELQIPKIPRRPGVSVEGELFSWKELLFGEILPRDFLFLV